MEGVTRDTTSSAEWFLDDPEPKARDTYTDDDGATALEYLAESLTALRDAVGTTDWTLTDAVRFLVEHADVQSLVDTVAMIQDLRRSLAVAEAYVSREVGYLVQEFSTAKAGQTSDGRPYEIMRGSVRKAWDHDGWKRDARHAVLNARVGIEDVLVRADTGETVEARDVLNDAIAAAQAVHGSTAPRVTALKALNLSPDDYCESTPGPYAIKITQSATTTTTTGD